MAFRNRNQQFFKARDEYRSRGPRDSPNSNSYNHVSSTGLLSPEVEMKVQHTIDLPPDWLARVSDIQYELQKISTKLGDLTELHRKHLLPGFDNREDQERAIEIATGEITKIFRLSQERIKSIGVGSTLTAEEEKQMKANIQSSLATQLQELSLSFRKAQKTYLQGLRNMQKKGRGSTTSGSFLDLEETAIEEVEERGFTADQLRQVNNMSNIISQREREIIQIAKSINDLAEIFKDLSLLVVDQGTILDRIDFNIEQTSQYTDDAVVQLRQANNEQKKYRTKLCILLLLILVFVMVIFVLIKGIAFPKKVTSG